jgi:hypothetical protein
VDLAIDDRVNCYLGSAQPDDGKKFRDLDPRAVRAAPPQILQTPPASGGEPRRPWPQVQITVKLSRARKEDPELVMARAYVFETPLIDHPPNGRHGSVDTRLEL